MIYIGNAFSPAMLPPSGATVEFRALTGPWLAAAVARRATSVVSHEDTAALFTTLLGTDVPMNRVNLSLQVGDTLLVGSYQGPRLLPGTTSLPEGAEIRWLLATVSPLPPLYNPEDPAPGEDVGVQAHRPLCGDCGAPTPAGRLEPVCRRSGEPAIRICPDCWQEEMDARALRGYRGEGGRS